MNEGLYNVTLDATAIIAGTSNTATRSYHEAAKVTTGDDTQRAVAYLKSFADSIDRAVKARGRDKTLMATAGDIQKVKNYDTMVKALEQLKKFLGINAELQALQTIHDMLVKYQPVYVDGYKHGIPLVTFEYEAASSALIRGISVLIVTQVEPKLDSIGKIRFSPVRKQSGGIFTKTAKDIAKQLKRPDHEKYLRELIDVALDPDLKVTPEEVVTEAVAFDTIGALFNIIRYGWNSIKIAGNAGKFILKSVFGIIPLIRTMVYLHYKKKADTIANLELQAHYVELNIQQLENMKNMDEDKKKEIIRKQQAYVDAYRKKAEKLRAELTDSEREGTAALEADNGNIAPSDDYVLD